MGNPTLAGLAFLGLVVCAGPAAASKNPLGEVGLACEACHTDAGWSPLRRPLEFEHDATGYRLEGAHRSASCRSCHGDLEFAKVGTACLDCHADAHRSELGTDCASCHGPRSWTSAREDRTAHFRTRFPLLGAHASLDCESCHQERSPFRYQTLPTDCVGCHEPDYRDAAFPDHDGAGFSTRCLDCHRTGARTWGEASAFAHPASFTLRGGHSGLVCASCHASSPRPAAACAAGCAASTARAGRAGSWPAPRTATASTRRRSSTPRATGG